MVMQTTTVMWADCSSFIYSICYVPVQVSTAILLTLTLTVWCFTVAPVLSDHSHFSPTVPQNRTNGEVDTVTCVHSQTCLNSKNILSLCDQ